MKKGVFASLIFLLHQLVSSAQVTNNQSVGCFGGFTSVQNGTTTIRNENGFCGYVMHPKRAQSHPMLSFFDGTEHKLLGGLHAYKNFDEEPTRSFLNWTAAKYETTVASQAYSMTCSRAFPAILHETEISRMRYRVKEVGKVYIAYEINHEVVIQEMDGLTANLTNGNAITAPWILIWAYGAEDFFPSLLILEKKPEKLVGTTEHLEIDYGNKEVGIITQSLLFGINQTPMTERTSWVSSLPVNVLSAIRFWSRTTQEFPISIEESYEVAGDEVLVKNLTHYKTMASEFDVTPMKITPLPPSLHLIMQNSYPATIEQEVQVSDYSTLWGEFAYVEGSVSNYTLPLPLTINHLPTPVQVSGDPFIDTYIKPEISARVTAGFGPLKEDKSGDLEY